MIDALASWLQAMNLEISDGVIAGVFALLGVMVERLLRLTGWVRCEVSGWGRKFTKARNSWNEYPEVEPNQAHKLAERMEYWFVIDLFNGKEVPSALRDVAVELVRKDGGPLRIRPCNLSGVKHFAEANKENCDTVDVINIPPRQIVRKQLGGVFDTREAINALASGRWKRVRLVAKRPKHPLLRRKTYRKTIHKPA